MMEKLLQLLMLKLAQLQMSAGRLIGQDLLRNQTWLCLYGPKHLHRLRLREWEQMLQLHPTLFTTWVFIPLVTAIVLDAYMTVFQLHLPQVPILPEQLCSRSQPSQCLQLHRWWSELHDLLWFRLWPALTNTRKKASLTRMHALFNAIYKHN